MDSCSDNIFRTYAVATVRDDLFLSVRVISWSTPYFQFDYILLTQIIHDHICTGLVSRLCFNIVIPGTIEDRFEIKKELFPAILLFKRSSKGPYIRIHITFLSPTLVLCYFKNCYLFLSVYPLLLCKNISASAVLCRRFSICSPEYFPEITQIVIAQIHSDL